jgi:hypothetical protein
MALMATITVLILILIVLVWLIVAWRRCRRAITES